MSKSMDRIEKQVHIKAPLSRVWEAITDARQFGKWFKVALETDFVVGQRVVGKMTYPGYEGWPFEAMVERMEPKSHFSLRWSPSPEPDCPSEITTLVEFIFQPAPDDGTLLTIVESGFSLLPTEMRDKVFRGNDEGWSIQAQNVKAYAES